jgi:FkbM family methyltransferase
MQPSSLIWRMAEFYGTRINHRGKRYVHRFLRSAFHLNSSCDLEVVRQGLLWHLNPSDFVQTHLYWMGEYEGWDLQQLSRWVGPNSIVVDVGANFGYYSVSLAAALQGKGRVYAFEPCRETFARLQTNIALNHFESNITAVSGGLSDSRGVAYLDRFTGNSGAATLTSNPTGDAVELDTLDHFCELHALTRLDVVKVDVEGSELRVINGGRQALSRFHPVVMIEFNSEALSRAGASVEVLDGSLRDLGYELFVASRDGLRPFQSSPGSSTVMNVLCLPPQITRQPLA